MDYSDYRKALSDKKEKIDESLLNIEVARYNAGDRIIVLKGRWKDGEVKDIKPFYEKKINI